MSSSNFARDGFIIELMLKVILDSHSILRGRADTKQMSKMASNRDLVIKLSQTNLAKTSELIL